MEKLGEGKKRPVLIDAGEYCSIDKEVREFSASEAGNLFTLADAIAYDSLAHKLIANFYLHQNKPAIPTRIFNDTGEALNWLRTFLN